MELPADFLSLERGSVKCAAQGPSEAGGFGYLEG